MNNKRVLITGASGMMGRALAEDLARDNEVVGVARFQDGAVRQRLEAKGVRCIPFDLRTDDVGRLPSDLDVFFHLAVHWGNDARESMAANAFALGHLIEHMKNLEQFVVGSTVAVYVGACRDDIKETSPAVPGGVYGTTKLVGDALATFLAEVRQVPAAILRYWFPYCNDPGVPNDYYQGLVRRLEAGDPFVLPDDDSGCQQPLFIDDLVRISVDALNFTSTEPFVLNVAGPQRLLLSQVVSTMAQVFQIEPKIEHAPPSQCNLLSGSYDLTKLGQTCGHGRVNFREGMERLKANWGRKSS